MRARSERRNVGNTPALEWLESTISEFKKETFWSYGDVRQSPIATTILNAGPEQQVAFICAVVERIGAIGDRLGKPSRDVDSRYANLIHQKGYPAIAVGVVCDLFRRKLPFTDDDVLFLVERTADLGMISEFALPHLRAIVGLIEKFVDANGLNPQLETQVGRLSRSLEWSGRAAEQRLIGRLRRMQVPDALPVEMGEPWAEQVVRDLKQKEEKRRAWSDLLLHCQSASSGSPTANWIASAKKIIAAVGPADFKKRVLAWFPLVDQPRTAPPPSGLDWRWERDHDAYITETNADVLKGLVWCSGLKSDARVARALNTLAISSYRKLPGIGPRLVKIGNACLWALGNMPGLDGVSQLAILKARVKFGTAQNLIDKAFNAAAEKAGLPRDEIEEMAVPSYGLDAVGVRREKFGEYVAELIVGEADAIHIRWFKPDGKPLKSVPAAVKKEHAEDLKELAQASKDLQRMLPAQRERIDSLFLAQKSWPLAVWRERYLNHLLVGVLARPLIWHFTKGTRAVDGIFHGGVFIDTDDRAIDGLDDDTRVELWHPIGRSIDEVQAWRRRLESHQIRQPFKQAHREVYILTDAERNTRTYSNRFAAHVLRQHQFNALCAARSWKNKLRLLVDAEYPPATRLLPTWNLRAEFWIEGIGDDYGTDTNDTGVYHRVATDQVRFYTLDAGQVTAHAGGGGYHADRATGAEPLPLEQIPPLVFSEILRDVDLFVGVASLGNDPTWQDGGPDGRFRDYWSAYAFGNLSETAKTRREVLSALLPRLQIADRCTLADKFLVVRGELRTYKIHLGSGNILMEPSDQYLCIMAARAGTKSGDARGVFLPFEGDGQLAIILSKAFLLAEDKKITDPSITRQIRL